MPLISVIIPVYKVEPYLRRCLGSVLSQTFTGWECIIVDDGSPDGCPAICDEYAAKDSRFAVIHRENRGTAHARDAGIKQAKGEFILFSDSDDWLENNALEILHNKQHETDADIVLGEIRNIFPFGESKTKYPEIDNNTSIIEYFFLNKCRTLWGKLYKKTLFDNYSVPGVNDGEDALVNVQIFSKITRHKLQAVNTVIYNYDQRTNGIGRRVSQRDCRSIYDFSAIKCRLLVEKELEKLPVTEREKSAFAYYMITEGMIQFFRKGNFFNRNEINIFYKKYYKPCIYKSKIRIRERAIIPLFYHSIPLGRAYIAALNIAIKIIQFVLKKTHGCIFI
jgi:glycosyltransferase involved in cell wall biosynthesis